MTFCIVNAEGESYKMPAELVRGDVVQSPHSIIIIIIIITSSWSRARPSRRAEWSECSLICTVMLPANLQSCWARSDQPATNTGIVHPPPPSLSPSLPVAAAAAINFSAGSKGRSNSQPIDVRPSSLGCITLVDRLTSNTCNAVINWLATF